MKIELELTDHYRLDFYPAALRRAAQHLGDSANPNEYAVVMEVAEQIEAHLPKPRIPEPGLYSVVRDGNGWDWVRSGVGVSTTCEWLCCETGDFGNWPNIDSPVLIHEGI